MKKIIIIGVIALFICVGFQSAFAIEPKVSENIVEKEEDCECQEIDKINPVRVKLLFTQLKVVTNILSKKFGYIPEVKEECQEILNDFNSFDYKDDRPVVCAILKVLYERFEMRYEFFTDPDNWNINVTIETPILFFIICTIVGLPFFFFLLFYPLLIDFTYHIAYYMYKCDWTG